MSFFYLPLLLIATVPVPILKFMMDKFQGFPLLKLSKIWFSVNKIFIIKVILEISQKIFFPS